MMLSIWDQQKYRKQIPDLHSLSNSVYKAPAPGDVIDHHFSCFVLSEGHICELDGRNSGIVRHQPSTEAEFLFVSLAFHSLVFMK